MSEDKKDETIGYAWNLVADLGNARQVSISGNFPKGVTAADMNAEIDKVRGVIDRQQAKSASRSTGEEVEQLILRRNAAASDLAKIDEKNEGKNGLTASERQQREAALAHIEKMDKDIEYKKTVHERLTKEAE